MAENDTPAPEHGSPPTRTIHCRAHFPKWLIQHLTPGSDIDRITLIEDDAIGKLLRAEARLVGDYVYRKIIVDDPWILEAFNVRPDHAGYIQSPPATKLQFEPVGEDYSNDEAPHPDTARLVDVTKVPASEAHARRHVEDEFDWSVTASTGQQRAEAWWNNAVDYPELKHKEDVIGASNEDEVDADSASQSATSPTGLGRANSVNSGRQVIDLTGEPDDDVSLGDVPGPGDIFRPPREKSIGPGVPSVATGQDSNVLPASSDHVPVIVQRAPPARSQARLGFPAPGDPENAAALSDLSDLRIQRDRLRGRNDSLVAVSLQNTDSGTSSELTESESVPTAKQFELHLAANHVHQAEIELNLAKSRRSDASAYPSELIVLEANVVKCEIRIEERYHTLYTLKASTSPNGGQTGHASAAATQREAEVPFTKPDRLRTQRDNLRARSDSLLASISQRTSSAPVHTRRDSADDKAALDKEHDWMIAAIELYLAELALYSALLDKRYPSQTASVDQTETRIAEAEVQVEERRHALYSLKVVKPSRGGKSESLGPKAAVAGAAPSPSAKSAAVTSQQPQAAASGSSVKNAETAAVDAFFVSIKPDHRCNNRIKCKRCRDTPSPPWLLPTAMAGGWLRSWCALTPASRKRPVGVRIYVQPHPRQRGEEDEGSDG